MKWVVYTILGVVVIFAIRAWLRSHNTMAGAPLDGPASIPVETQRRFENAAIKQTAKNLIKRNTGLKP